jgi:hypothetical protein
MPHPYFRLIDETGDHDSVRATGNSDNRNMNSKQISKDKDLAPLVYSLEWKNSSDDQPEFIGNFLMDLEGLFNEGLITFESDYNKYRAVIKHNLSGDLVLGPNNTGPQVVIGNLPRKENSSSTKKSSPPRKTTSRWPEWEMIPDPKLEQIFKDTAQYIRFLDPRIIEAVVKDNKKNHSELWDILEKSNIDPSIYLWEGSACAFPGARRGTGKYEKKASVVKMEERGDKQCLYFDNNLCPRQIWSYVFLGKAYPNKGPQKYSLAHLAAHKDYNKDQIREELTLEREIKENELSGLFSAANNSCYSPSSVMKPTDYNVKLRKVLLKKAHDLYKDSCLFFPPGINLKEFEEGEVWDFDKDIWSDPVGDTENLEQFFEFRLNWLREKSDAS